MKCPRCRNEMNMDGHRKVDLMMCYACGYIEGRNTGSPEPKGVTNFEHMKDLNFNETLAFIAGALKVNAVDLGTWMDETTAQYADVRQI